MHRTLQVDFPLCGAHEQTSSLGRGGWGREEDMACMRASSLRSMPTACSPARHGRSRRSRRVRVACHGAPSKVKMTGFVGDMRRVAMKLHTPSQAPKEGERVEQAPKERSFEPSLPGYLRFLSESMVVYDTIESAIEAEDALASFRRTGLERGPRLARDIAFMRDLPGAGTGAVDLEDQEEGEEGHSGLPPGQEYAAYLRCLLENGSLPQFICHYYNFYFAATAGGMMIGKAVRKKLDIDHELEFYQYGDDGTNNGDVNAMLDGVREKLNAIAEVRPRETKAAAVQSVHASGKESRRETDNCTHTRSYSHMHHMRGLYRVGVRTRRRCAWRRRSCRSSTAEEF